MAQYNNSSETRVLVDGSAFATFFEQKVQKISHALYMVTSYIPEGEPLRYSIRRVALDMIESLHDNDLFGGASVRVSFEPLFGQVLSYLSISKTMGYISEMNTDILTGEIKALANLVTDDTTTVHGLLSRDFFAVPAPQALQAPRTTSTQQISTQPNSIQSSQTVPQIPQGQFSNSQNKGQKNVQSISKPPSNGQLEKKDIPVKKTQTTRRDKILDLFKQGKETITVNDVEKAIQGCSKKTMQRELFSLVEDGVLEKEGEKRWSEYRLVQQN